ncbi:MAG: hypothetical protein R2827_09920 [Bdellovibrionales bacterium]
MKLALLISLLALPVMASASDISFNQLIEKANMKRDQLSKDVSALIEKHEYNKQNAEVIDFIADELNAMDSHSKIVESEKAKGPRGL